MLVKVTPAFQSEKYAAHTHNIFGRAGGKCKGVSQSAREKQLQMQIFFFCFDESLKIEKP